MVWRTVSDLSRRTLSSISVLMGHSSTRTTERFYGRQKNLMAIEKARKTWESGPEETSSENPSDCDGKRGYDSERTMDQL